MTECYPRPGWPNHCIFAHRQLVGVRKQGWSVHVLLPNGWYPPGLWPIARAWREARHRGIAEGWSIDGIAVGDLVVQNRVPSRLSRPRDGEALVARALVERLRHEGARSGQDVVLCQFALPYGPPVAAACRELDLRYVIYLRGDDVWVWPHTRSRGRERFAWAVRGAYAVVAVSAAILDEARQLADHALPRGVVLHNGIDHRHFRPADAEERRVARAVLGIGPDEPVILCVAAAIARKGWCELMDAFGESLPEHAVLLGVAQSKLAELDLSAEFTRRAGQNGRFVLRQDVPGAKMASLYHAADVFCLPTYGEGLSNAVLEAMACGLPVVTTPVGGHPEVLTDGVEGVFVPPRDRTALREALGALLRDEARRGVMGAAARRRAESIGTSDETGARLAALLDGARRGESPIRLDAEGARRPGVEVGR